MIKDRWTLGLAVFLVVGAAATLGVWIPNDIETGLIERFRREILIGDALAPTAVVIGILIAALALGITSWLKPDPYKDTPDKQSFAFLGRIAVAIILSLILMRYSGPLVVDLINVTGADIGSYRTLRDTVPYKYIGFAIGGFAMIFGVIRVVENRFSAGAAWLALIAVIVLGVIYDVPFDDLLLPPNGDF